MTTKPWGFALACGVILAMPLLACARSPAHMATGEEIGEAVRIAEVEMAQARAKRSSDPGNESLTPKKHLAERAAEQ